MNINSLLLTKEELPILDNICFRIPIHPKLLDPNLKLNPSIAKDVFPKVVEEWCRELKKNFPLGWQDEIQLGSNGFVTGFSISRNYGGALYFEESDKNCESLLPNRLIKFSDEKSDEFKYKTVGKYLIGLVYASHNINDYPGALFLRNWAMMYMNEVLKEIAD